MNIYVGNLSFSSNEDGLKQLFEQFGSVSMVKMMKDKITGQLQIMTSSVRQKPSLRISPAATTC